MCDAARHTAHRRHKEFVKAMNKISQSSTCVVSNRYHEIERKSAGYLWIVVACGVVLSVGFVCAAAQQIAAVNYGYECEKMRSEQALLLAEQKRLQLAFSEATAPRNLESTARKHGLTTARASQIRSTVDVNSGVVKQVSVVKQVPVVKQIRASGSTDLPNSPSPITLTARRTVSQEAKAR